MTEGHQENIAYTYGTLAHQVPHTTVEWAADCVSACGSFPHPICNFLMRLGDRPVEPPQHPKSCFQLFAFSEATGQLAPMGFRLSYDLAMMEQRQRPNVPPASLTLAERPESRQRIAQFMIDLFFESSGSSFRQVVRNATMAADELAILSLDHKGKSEGAVLLARTTGILGVFNLCVRSEVRGRGLGSQILSACSDIAQQENRRLVLQCDSKLIPFYQANGFLQVGWLRAWVPIPERID